MNREVDKNFDRSVVRMNKVVTEVLGLERIDELARQAGIRFEFLHDVVLDDFDYITFTQLLFEELSNKNKEVIQKTIALAIMDQFWGGLPTGYDWKEQAESLLVTVDDSGEGRESVMDLTNKIFKALSK